ncbi:MAG: DNA polymerase III subunit delta [Phycisphaerae bacterium]
MTGSWGDVEVGRWTLTSRARSGKLRGMAASSGAKPVYAVVGSDAFLQTQRLKEVLAKLPKDAARIDVDGERAELAGVLDELRSFAMFGGGKAVVVADADEFVTRYRSQLEDYCEAPADSGTLVLRMASLPKNQRIYKIIVKSGEVLEAEPPKDLISWAIKRAKEAHGLALTPAAAGLFKELIGDDLGRIDNELAKLALQCESGKADVKDVQSSVAFQREQEMWHMTDEISAGHTTQALRRWRQLTQMDTSAEFRAVTWLGMWLEKAVRAVEMKRRGANPFQIAKDLKIWPAEKGAGFVQTAERMGDGGLYRAMNLLVEIDRQSKSGVGDAAENVERFILTVGNAAGGEKLVRRA